MAPRRNTHSVSAEVSLVHLQNCLVNLPASLVSLLVNVNTPAQNVIVELGFKATSSAPERSIYLGWTGMPSKRRVAPMVSRDGINGLRGSSRDQEVALVEVDATLASSLGITDGDKILATIHLDPPLAHTVNIEPLTPEDWEIIELHATFLELNLLSQIRALPNPAYKDGGDKAVPPHPLTLHLSPTSTASIKILSLEPAQPADVPFAKISPDAEVIVAPKTKAKPSQNGGSSRSVASTSKSRRSGASTAKRSRDEWKPTLFLRGLDRSACEEWFDEAAPQDFSVWVDRDALHAGNFRDVKYVLVDVIRPAGLQPNTPKPPQEAEPPSIPETTKVVAHLRHWDEPPNSQVIALSSPLTSALSCSGIVGGVVKIEPAVPPVARDTVQQLKIFPFAAEGHRALGGLRFGGESRAEKEESAKQFKHIYAKQGGLNILTGPLTDGMVLGTWEGLDTPLGWEGGVLQFDPQSSSPESGKSAVRWAQGLGQGITVNVQPPIPRRPSISSTAVPISPEQEKSPLVGIDTLLDQLYSHLSHLSSTLLTGGLGSGKTSAALFLANRLRNGLLYHTTYFECRKLVNDESRLAAIKETLNRLFMTASWGARLGGKAIVILDDLDRLCPVETELQVGNDNSRSRQISELVCSIARQYCTQDSGVVLLATAQGKDTLNNVIVAGHVVREIVDLKAPDKEARRVIMEAIAKQDASAVDDWPDPSNDGSRPTTANGSGHGDDDAAWMDGASQASRGGRELKPEGFMLDADLDFLDVAGRTDGYLPGDLTVLISRARNEAIIRAVNDSPSSSGAVRLSRKDFDAALKGFTPAPLRNVSLQSSSTTFDSIGGLQETRRVLLETLQYPTKYAPIFAQCPLRLRSGLLLYGYPGCGKTLLASAVAGECGLNFISVKGPEILNKYIGASEKSVRDLFERAQAAKPCVLFFDEFDSIAPKRGHDSTGVTDRVVNQLLTQMDGAEGLSGVYVLAATSRPDLIDPALLRPGRLDKSLLCDLPTLEDRVDILKALSKKVRLSSELAESENPFREIAAQTEGFSGADLQALVSNAQLEAIHSVLQDNPLVSDATRRTAKEVTPRSGGAIPSFVQFPFGASDPGVEAKPSGTRAGELAENAAILAKLEGIKLARKRAKRQLLGEGGSNGVINEDGDRKSGEKEVVVSRNDFARALGSTRASISSEEKLRLTRIYREFVVGRSGEMRDGQGSMAVGGRSSLM